MKIKGYVVEELPDSCGECQFLEVMMGDDETWCFCEITHDLIPSRYRRDGRPHNWNSNYADRHKKRFKAQGACIDT